MAESTLQYQLFNEGNSGLSPQGHASSGNGNVSADGSAVMAPLGETNPVPHGMAERDSSQPDPIFAEAKRRFNYCLESEAYARQRWIADLKFAEADSDNGYQWPNNLRKNRDIDNRPYLTINMTRQYNLQIINDAKQNKPGIKVRPTGNGATAESAQVYQDVIRYIERKSKASLAYDKATEFQVKAGLGAWRIVTDYASSDSFDQELRIIPVWDPLTVYWDPDAVLQDKSDANFGFVYQDFSKSIFETIWPEWKDDVGTAPLGNDMLYWTGRDQVRVAEYFRRIKEKDLLVSYVDPETGQRTQVLQSKLGEELAKAILANSAMQPQSREVWNTIVEWYMIIGQKVKAKTRWLGSIIPLIPVIGEEVMIDGVLDRKGHTRALKDPQRIYNYWSTSAVEQVALQSKTPYIAPAKAIESFETYWNTANRANPSVLPYNHVDDEGQPIPAPSRQEPPSMAQAYVQGLGISKQDMASVSGQQDASMGEPSNERTGLAIQQRTRPAKNAVFHFADNVATAIRSTGAQLIELIPKVYDTQRILRITADDGMDYELLIDPQAQQAYQQKMNYKGQVVQRIFNPSVGTYEVEADIGPDYATRREEAWNAYSVILTQAPALVNVLGDLLFRAGDFPFAEEAAARLKRMLPAQAQEGGPSPELLQLQTQLQNTQNALASALNRIAVQEGEIKEKDRLRDTGEYDAETKRLSVLLKAIEGESGGQQGLKALVDQLVSDAMSTHLTQEEDLEPSAMVPRKPAVSSPSQGGPTAMSAAPPVPGAKLAPDGMWYVADTSPGREGKYLQVNTGAVGTPGA